MSKHLTEMAGLVHKLLGMGEKLAEYWIVAMLLSSLPEYYNPLITMLEGRSESELKLEYVKGKLLDEWRRRCERDENCDDWNDKALKVGIQRREGKREVKGFNRECYYCHADGHIKQDCPKLTARQAAEGRQRTEDDDDYDYGRGPRESGSRNVCFTSSVTTNIIEPGGWIIDSGSTMHMTGDKQRLKNVKPCRSGVFLADGTKVFARATGTCEFSGCGVDGEEVGVQMKNVAYVPELDANVISVNRMVEEGFTDSFGLEGCKIFKNDRVVLVGEKRGKLFNMREPEN